jgi:hypothetical protein
VKRRHLFEFEDLKWFPKNIRNYGTDFLQFVSNQFDFYRPIVPVLKKGIEKSENKTIIDLGSGGGGGWKKLSKHLTSEGDNLKIILTDYYPNIVAFQKMAELDSEHFSFEKESVNALDVDERLKGLRTMFLSFHHFKPEDARQVLQNAADAEQPIAIFEGQERNIGHILRFLLSPINVLITTPFIRPFKWERLILTYIIPIVPLFVLWDGVVSALRTYSQDEMQDMTASLKNSESFEWEIGKTKDRGITIVYLLGYKA